MVAGSIPACVLYPPSCGCGQVAAKASASGTDISSWQILAGCGLSTLPGIFIDTDALIMYTMRGRQSDAW